MPRKSRRKIVGKREDMERAERERLLAALAEELRVEWRRRSDQSEP